MTDTPLAHIHDTDTTSTQIHDTDTPSTQIHDRSLSLLGMEYDVF